MTNCTGLNPDVAMPMPDWAADYLEEMPIPDYLFSSILAFTYNFSISYSKKETNSSCLWMHRLYHFPLHAVGTYTGYSIPFTNPNTSSMDMQGVFFKTVLLTKQRGNMYTITATLRMNKKMMRKPTV